MPPLRPVAQISSRYSELVRTVNGRLQHCKIHLESALTHDTYLEKFRRAELDLVLAEPHQVLAAEKLRYNVFVKTGPRDRIAGVVVIRRDAAVHSVRELAGKTLCFGSPDALASTMLVRMWLRHAGLEASAATPQFTGSPEAALLEVLYGGADAAGASVRGWQDFLASHPEAARELQVRWTTNDLSGPALMAHARVPAAHVAELARVFDALEHTPEGKSALGKSGYSDFRKADASAYDDVWELTKQYTRSFATQGGSRL